MDATPRNRRILEVLFLCGIVASLINSAMDVYAAWRWDEYQYAHQTVSELSAIGAPTRPMWLVMGYFYAPLLFAFGCGVWLAAGRRRALRVAGALLAANAIVALFWPPMHLRGEPTTMTDTLHLVFVAVTGLISMVAMGLAAAALSRRFRIYTIVTIVLMLVAGGVTSALAGPIPKGLPTPWIGLVERVNFYGLHLWVVVLSVTLWRELLGQATSRFASPALPRGSAPA